MNSWWWLSLALPVVIATTWFLVRRNAAVETEAPPRKWRKSGPVKVSRNQPHSRVAHYYGVSVRPGGKRCDAIMEIIDNRYLSQEAPHLPLPGCDQDECDCVMMPEGDRRVGYDRRGDTFSAYGNFELDRHAQKRTHKDDRREPF